MEYTYLGETGLEVSRVCLGTLAFGSKEYHDWILPAAEARPIIERAIELGITFFDTANVYSYGESERILGNVLGEYDRDRFVIASKVNPNRGPNPYPPSSGSGGLSRKAIEQSLTGTLKRLQVETLDLYQLHRWDYGTPIEETLRTLDDAVRRGLVRYLGASSMWAYQFGTAIRTAERLGLEGFASMQNQYNAVYREEELEMLPLCRQEGVGVMPWGVLAQGYLTRPHASFAETRRGSAIEETAFLSDRQEVYRANGGQAINERVQEVAAEKDVTMAQLALAWVLHQDGVDAPIIGATSVSQLEETVEALSIELSPDELAYLEEPYEPGRVVGHE